MSSNNRVVIVLKDGRVDSVGTDIPAVFAVEEHDAYGNVTYSGPEDTYVVPTLMNPIWERLGDSTGSKS